VQASAGLAWPQSTAAPRRRAHGARTRHPAHLLSIVGLQHSSASAWYARGVWGGNLGRRPSRAIWWPMRARGTPAAGRHMGQVMAAALFESSCQLRGECKMPCDSCSIITGRADVGSEGGVYGSS
jgi:hypothetical protein